MQLTLGNPTVGDVVRELEQPVHTGENNRSVQLAGKYSVVVFYGVERLAPSTAALLAFRDAYAQFQSRGAQVIGIGISPADQQKAFVEANLLPYPLVCDAQLEISALLGALRPKENKAADSGKLELNASRRTLLVGPDRRIVRIYENPDSAGHIDQVIKEIDALLMRDPPRMIVSHAPVLLIPNVLPQELCKRLIQIWHDQGNEDSGFMKQIDGKTVGMYDYAHKIRRDHFMQPGPDLDVVKKYISARLVTAVKTAFNFDATRFEDFRIACYDASRGGYFRPHRDNTTDGTAHRRFAMSLLLNDDYQGGSLRFPEFAPHEYRPQAGAAVIFSCSLLHEATDVTAGRRFVLLSFLYGDKEAKIREEYNLRTGGQYRATTT